MGQCIYDYRAVVDSMRAAAATLEAKCLRINAILGDWQLGMVEVHQSGAPLAWGNYISQAISRTSS
ncbi:MAG TPA: hypothetical protein VEW05_26555 [Candidatus Polarisedimenticolia bacterium]|nr:hypothetical protein [Candidatus Polarisedimenticolia bacterium]